MNKKTKALIFIIIVIIVGLLAGIYLINSKYDEISILSIRREYNMAFSSEKDSIDIPLYVEKKTSFLTKVDSIDSSYIYNDFYMLKCNINSIELGSKIKYQDKTYYEFIYNISFNQIGSIDSNTFISDAIFDIRYINGEEVEFNIGNMSLSFYDHFYSDDIYITKLQGICNTVGNVETVVGINISFYNNTDSTITINNLDLNNKYYNFDYMNYSSQIKMNANLSVVFSPYSYLDTMIETGNMELSIQSKQTKDIFVPIKYLNGIKYVDRFPIVVTYNNGNKFVIDDFMFIRSSIINSNNGIIKYEYKYNQSK